MARDLDWLRKQVALKIDYEVDEPDQDIEGTTANPWYKVDAALNEAQDFEWAQVVQEGNIDHWRAYTVLSWPQNQLNFTLPKFLQHDGMISIEDVTNGTPGTMLWVLPRQAGYVPLVTWQDGRTITWRPNGPPVTKSLSVAYIAQPYELENSADEPQWLPERYRHLLVWSAAAILRDTLDEEVPASWRKRIDDLRWRFWNAMAASKPMEPARQTIINHDTGGVRRLV